MTTTTVADACPSVPPAMQTAEKSASVLIQEGLQKELEQLQSIQDLDLFLNGLKGIKAKLHTVEGDRKAFFTLHCTIVSMRIERLIHKEMDVPSERYYRFESIQDDIDDFLDDFEELYEDIVDSCVELDRMRNASEFALISELDKVASGLKASLLQAAEARLSKVSTGFSQAASLQVQNLATREGFEEINALVEGRLTELIKQEPKIAHDSLRALFHKAVNEIRNAFQQKLLTRYAGVITRDVLPLVREQLRIELQKSDRKELLHLKIEVKRYARFFRQIVSNVGTENSILEPILGALSILEKAMIDISARIGEIQAKEAMALQAKDSASQHITGGGGAQLVLSNSPHAVVNLGGSSGIGYETEASKSLLGRIQGIALRTLGGVALENAIAIAFATASVYFRSNLSLGWSLVSGVATTAAPLVSRMTAEQLFPRPLLPLMVPLFENVTRFLALYYGPQFIEVVTNMGAVLSPAAATATTAATAPQAAVDAISTNQVAAPLTTSDAVANLPASLSANLPANLPESLPQASQVSNVVLETLWAVNSLAIASIGSLVSFLGWRIRHRHLAVTGAAG